MQRQFSCLLIENKNSHETNSLNFVFISNYTLFKILMREKMGNGKMVRRMLKEVKALKQTLAYDLDNNNEEFLKDNVY